jgi:hypothetical protein
MPKPNASPSLKWTGTKGDDTALVASVDALGRTTYDGAAGYDTLDLSALTSGVSIDVVLGKPGFSRVWPDSPFTGSWWDYSLIELSGGVEGTIKNFEKIVGTEYNDFLSLRGGAVARVVDGGAGDDAIYIAASSGTSTAIGGLGSDQLFGNRIGDVLVGGTYINGSAPGDDTRDEFEVFAGTILDFELGVDTLYIDAANLPGDTTTATWVDVTTTTYGAGAQLTIASDRVITLIGVSAEDLNALDNGYVMDAQGGDLTSLSGDDFIFDSASTGTIDRFIFPSGSGDDELVGFDVQIDTLVFANAPTFTEVDYHGEAALLATYDSGGSSVLLIGLGASDQSSLQIEVLPPDLFI